MDMCTISGTSSSLQLDNQFVESVTTLLNYMVEQKWQQFYQFLGQSFITGAWGCRRLHHHWLAAAPPRVPLFLLLPPPHTHPC